MIQFGAVEIPIGVPAAEQTLNILAKIDQRAQLVVEHIGDVSLGVQRTAGKTAPALDMIGTHSEGLSRRFEHLGVMSAFAFTAIANGSERGLTRLAHGVAFLGFAFGPLTGAITSFVAIAGEQLIEFWHKSEEGAKKAAEANQKFLDSVGEAKNLAAAARRQQQLYSGAEYTTEEDPVLRAGIKGGGIQALTARMKPLRDEYEKLAAPTAGKPIDLIPAATMRRMQELEPVLSALDEKLQPLLRAFEATSKLTGALTVEAVKAGVTEDREKTADKAKRQHEQDLDAELERIYEAAREKQAANRKATDETFKLLRDADEEEKKAEDDFYKWALRESDAYNKAVEKQREKDLEHQRRVAEKAQDLARTTASVIGDTMKGLFSGGIGGGFKALGDGILKSLGDIFIQIGEKMLAASAIFGPLAEWLTKPFDPGAGLAFAVGGAALIALGAGMGAMASGGGRGGGGSGIGSAAYREQKANATYQPNYAPNTAGVRALQPLTVNVTAFGKHDPTFQRELLEAIAVAQRRGTTAG